MEFHHKIEYKTSQSLTTKSFIWLVLLVDTNSFLGLFLI